MQALTVRKCLKELCKIHIIKDILSLISCKNAYTGSDTQGRRPMESSLWNTRHQSWAHGQHTTYSLEAAVSPESGLQPFSERRCYTSHRQIWRNSTTISKSYLPSMLLSPRGPPPLHRDLLKGSTRKQYRSRIKLIASDLRMLLPRAIFHSAEKKKERKKKRPTN